MNNIFYFRDINAIGGIETFFYYLAKTFKDWDITIYYKTGDSKQIERLKQYVRVIRYTNQHIVCDKAFFNFNTEIIDEVEAKEYGLILHGDYEAMIKQRQLTMNNLPLNDKIDQYYGVSQLVCDSFEKLTGIKPQLIYNPLAIDEPKKMLRLISATRLTKEKGRDRILKLGEMLNQANIPYTWLIFTNDGRDFNNDNIVLMKPRLDIIDYIADADYLVQLSDNEGYCYSIVESLIVGTPVIATDLPVLKELGLNKTNSFILDFDMENVPVEDIYNKKLEFKYIPKKSNWEKFLEKGKSTYQEEKNKRYLVEALDTYEEDRTTDSQLGRIPKTGEQFVVDKERLEVLLGDNSRNKVYVKLIKEVTNERNKKD